MQCRQATLTAVNSPPNVVNPGNLTGIVGVPVDITIGASDPEGQAITFSATGLPTGLSINSDTGRITGTPTVPGSFNVVITVTDRRQQRAPRDSPGPSTRQRRWY